VLPGEETLLKYPLLSNPGVPDSGICATLRQAQIFILEILHVYLPALDRLRNLTEKDEHRTSNVKHRMMNKKTNAELLNDIL
jgi:hypothetical protein